jgi:uncharacterized damage-inducible protein DinB
MISPDYAQTLARYNEWMNSRLFALCATVPEADLQADRGAFFKSIYATLNHIAYADLAFLARFTGTPAVVPELGADLFGGFAALRGEREALDRRLIDWTGSLSEAWLGEPLTYTSKVDGLIRTLPRWLLLGHLFNHQTHHRGQVTTLLAQRGLDIGSTDLPFMPSLQPRP